MSVITIAREFGAGGRTLGTMLADKLGYTLIDEEIVEMIALEANVPTGDVDSIADDKGDEGFLSKLLHRFGPFRQGYVGVSMEKNPGYIDGDLYISLLHKVIPRIAADGNVVIIGRGGQYILADRPDTYHFLLVADLEHRISFMMKNYNLDRKKAQFVIEKQGKRRFNLYRYFAKIDYDQPSLYHMVFNMNRIKMEEAVHSICHLVTGESCS